MKQMKKLVAVFTAGFMLCSSSFAFAAGNSIPRNEQSQEQTIILNDEIVKDGKKLTPGEATQQAPLQQTESGVEETVSNALKQADVAPLESIANPNTRAYYAYYQTITGSIATEGTIQPYGIITLAPNQILQAGLECPNNDNMDYDLYIASVTDAGTVGDVLVGSMYTTHRPEKMTKTLDEGVDYINTSAQNQKYAILVHAKKGGGTAYPYTVYYSVDAQGNYNTNEADQNAATPMGTLPFGYYVNNVALNSPADVDWIALDNTLDNAYDYAKIDFKIADNTTGEAITTDNVELYKHMGDNKMELIPKGSDGYYRFTSSASNTGQYFIRITPKDRTNMDWHQYKISVDITELKTKPAKLTYKFSTDKDPSGSNYVIWPELGNAYCLNAIDWFQVEGTVTDAFGDPVNVTSTAYVEFINFYWRDIGKNENLARRIDQIEVKNNSKFVIRMNDFPPPAGYYTYRNSASKLTHHYDLAQVFFMFDEFSATIPVYHFSYAA